MRHIQVFHNPRFLAYRGEHDQILPPLSPTASVQVPADMAPEEMLNTAYARTQHGYLYSSWFQDPTVIPHLRSTSVGDLLATDTGALFVVERLGFRPFRPIASSWQSKLATSVRQLDGVVALAQDEQIRSAIQDSLIGMNRALLAEEFPVEEHPQTWESAQVGDLIGNDTLGYYRVFARNLKPKWRAILLQEPLPQGQIWRDNKGWAVLQPTDEQIR